METIFIRRQIAAPVAVVWRELNVLSSYDSGLAAAAVEVLGGQPPTFLSFRLLRGAPVRGNVVAVQLHPGVRGSTELVLESAFQVSLTGMGGWGRRRMRHLLMELTQRLEDAAEQAWMGSQTGGGQFSDSPAGDSDRDPRGEHHGRDLRHLPCV